MQHKSKIFESVVLVVMTFAVASAWAQRGDDTNRLSKNGRVEGVIDGVSVTVEFGRPDVKERQIWGGLVPYGKVWRTGANESTTIEFDSDVSVVGSALPAGVYSLFTIPGEGEWTVIFNKVAQQWGTFNYDEKQDILRVTVTPRRADHTESLDFQIEASEVVLRWEELAVPIAVSRGR